jgi:hypothetical protein
MAGTREDAVLVIELAKYAAMLGLADEAMRADRAIKIGGADEQ